jgi:hypothetical protein
VQTEGVGEEVDTREADHVHGKVDEAEDVREQ